jgi:sensor histidine kinase YesM
VHPILASGARLAAYFGFWLLVGVLLAVLVASDQPLTWSVALLIAVPLANAYGFLCLSAWYVARSMPLGGTRALRMLATVVTAALASSAIWLLAARSWTALLRTMGVDDVPSMAVGAVNALLFGLGVLLYLLALAVAYLLVTFEQSRAAERRGLEVQMFAREAELRSLRAQIDPHFLFNSLHSISALTAIDPQAARRMTIQLGQFLRDTLAVGSKARIPLARELQLAERYLEIERVRFGDRLQVEVDAGGADRCLVPPLLLQPLVENAVTHGIAQAIGGGTIRLAAWTTSGSLRIRVENPCDPDRPRRTGTGVGLSNVRARLTALHGDAAWVTAAEAEGAWRVEIALPLAVAEPAEQAVGS